MARSSERSSGRRWWSRGPNPRRRTELGLLVLVALVTVACYVLASLGSTSHIPPHLGWFLATVLGLILVAHLANRLLAPQANPVLLPIVALLNGVGYVIVARWDPADGSLQAAWTGVGVLAYILALIFVRHTRDLDRYRYILLLAAAILLLLPLAPGIGSNVSSGGQTVRLWVHFGPLSFQPVEIAKICLCIFFASYFAEKKEMLSIPSARVGNRLVLDPRPLVPILVAWGFAMAVIALEDDIGFALLLFVLFMGMLWLATGRFSYLLLGFVLFAAGAVLAAHLFPQVHERVTVWLDPWKTVNGGLGEQIGYGWFALGLGGVGGVGLGVASGVPVPLIQSDMIFAGIGWELGLLGTSSVVFAFLLLGGTGLRIAQAARSDFAKLLAAGLTILVCFQAIFIMAGVLRLLPFTGLTLPFMAYGGSSLVANYVLVAILMRVSQETATAELSPSDVPVMNERRFVVAA